MLRILLALCILGIGASACATTSRVQQPAPSGGEHTVAAAPQPHGEHDHAEPPADSSSPGEGPREAHDRRGGPEENQPQVDTAAQHSGTHEMWAHPLGDAWRLLGMAQLVPIVTLGSPFNPDTPLRRTEWLVTQPAVMLNLEGRGARLVLRTTLNLEALTMRDGELTLGGWGEGYIDSRHPHTLLHEVMLSLNLWQVAGGALSLSAGKGFAPYGSDDPMVRPVTKYPTNHHLSQILERWTLNGIYLLRGWSVEGGIFGGAEPTGPYDLSNIRSFPDSWSLRVARRFGSGFGPLAPWEVSSSYARVVEHHHAQPAINVLTNVTLRHERRYGFGTLYALGEASRSRPHLGNGDFSVLGESQLTLSRHRPYYRLEYATRPEFPRDGEAGEAGFFRYDNRYHPIGATRWLINSLGYGFELSGLPLSGRPFIELQHHRLWWERGFGSLAPERLFGTNSVWKVTAGMRLFFGGGPMRMGAYGILDPMTVVHRQPTAQSGAEDPHLHH